MADMISKEAWLKERWGHLRLDETQELPEVFSKGTGQQFHFVCACDDRRVLLPMYRVTTGNSTSCGKCNFKPKSYWKKQRWGTLRLDQTQELPDEWGAVRQKFRMICDCTRICDVAFKALLMGHNKSCGHCNDKPKSYWLNQEWGTLRLKDVKSLPKEWPPFSTNKFTFICSCAKREVSMPFSRVTTGNSSSCGQCSLIHRDVWVKKRFGSLRLDPTQELPEYIKPYSNSKFRFLCDCNKEHPRVVTLPLKSVAGDSPAAQTCGGCNYKSLSFWLEQHWGHLRLDRTQELPEEWGSGWKHRVWFICAGCKKRKKALFTDVLKGDTKSCGCLKVGENEYSEENEVRKFAISLDSTTHPKSWDIEGSRMKYDVYIKDRKFAIEYHGLHWHSERLKDEMEAKLIRQGLLKAKTPPAKKDRKKYELACSMGDQLIQIYEDEWKLKQPIMMGMIQDIVAPLPKTRIRPVFEVARAKTPPEALRFLDQNHYLGADGGCLTVVAKHQGGVVGVWVFKKKDGAIMWHRACWDRKYKYWNPHEKALRLVLPILKDMGFTRMVTFSDNRFHTGALYEKLGFTFEEEIESEYFYTNERIRKTKFSFRVPAGVNEEEAARAKGWYRIYDSGKRRFSLTI